MAGFMKRTFGGGAELSARDEMKEAVAYFVILMIYADGEVEETEVNAAQGSLCRCQLFSDNSIDDDFKLLQKMETKMLQDAEGNAEHYAEILKKDDWKYTAAAIMTDIMLSDGDMDADEAHLLQHLGTKVGIEESELEAMTITIKALRRSWRN